MAQAGLTAPYMAALMVFNIAYGPWQSAAWFYSISQQGEDLSDLLMPDDPILLRYWPRILRDRGLELEASEDLVGRPARVRFIKELGTGSLMELKGVKAKPSQWMSLQRAFDNWDAGFHTRGLALGALCINKGWIVTEEDLFAPARASSYCGVKPGEKKSAAEEVKSATVTPLGKRHSTRSRLLPS